jgi:hypothetical protein
VVALTKAYVASARRMGYFHGEEMGIEIQLAQANLENKKKKRYFSKWFP